jgi:hypothetical protein
MKLLTRNVRSHRQCRMFPGAWAAEGMGSGQVPEAMYAARM